MEQANDGQKSDICRQVEEMLAAFALGALEPDEQAFVEAHLDACPSCRAQFDDYFATTALLAKAVPQRTPPSAIKQALLEQARASVAGTRTSARQRQEQKREQEEREREHEHERKGVFERLMDGLRGVWRNSLRLAPVGLLAALIAACVAIGALAFQVAQLSNQLTVTQARLDQQQEAIQTFWRAYTAETDLFGTKVATSASATLRFSPNIRFGLLKINGLATLPETQAYQLWLVDSTGKRDSGAIFNVPQQPGGEALVVVRAPRTFDNYVRFGVSIEPVSGSPGPTGPAALTSQRPAAATPTP